MSINHPKQRQIRLPFDVPKPNKSTPTQRSCGICHKTEGKYTCPRCNLVYCSLACFRDEKHSQCSEPFYKSTIMESISNDPKVELEEKRKMLEMLKRFEDAQLEGEGVEDFLKDFENDEGEEDELTKALSGVNLDNIDSNRLFHLLPQSHRDAFLAAIKNPESEEAKALLESAVSDDSSKYGPAVLPWWERERDVSRAFDVQEDDDSDANADAEENPGDQGRDKYAEDPELQDRLEGINPQPGIGLKLIYNAVALTFAYLHICLSYRLPALDQKYLEIQEIPVKDIKFDISNLVPFLTDVKSTIRYETARDAYSTIWEKIGEDPQSAPPQPKILIRLLKIIIRLLRPRITTDPPRLLLVLSDLYRLYKPVNGKHTPAERKLGFYLVALRQIQRNQWLMIMKEVEKEVTRLEGEVGPQDDGRELDGEDETLKSLRIV